jgi:bifunctional UDP-N-acetylglucosamine pyrophosphorylase/glucosamine-1-phosphate N-acetyltransferase
MYGDMPLIQPNILSALHAARGRCPAALLTVRSRQIAGFGRVIRSADGRVQAIIEEKECTTEQLQIDELNGGIYCFDTTWIEQALPKLAPHGDGEYYLTDVAEYAARLGNPVATWLASDPDEVWGVNNREQLATANGILRQRIAQRLMLSGVTIMDPAAAYIDDTVQIGIDTIIYPNTTIVGNTRIGENCHIGPNAYLRDSSIGNACRVNASIVEDSKMDDGSSLGPFSHIRDGAHLSSGVYLGNYAEVKNASLGQGTLMHHFGYVGDATVGKEVNIAAGVVTCNFNSETREKSHTQIGDRAAVGSDTMLIAPLTVGEGAITAAGSVVTHDVDNGTLVAGVPARPVRRVQPLLAGTDERESKE